MLLKQHIMENKDRDAAGMAAPQHDWRNAETNASPADAPNTEYDERSSANASHFHNQDDESVHAMRTAPDEEDEEENTEDEAGDWGHTDPADSPFPDSNDPSGPGSAV